MAEGCNEYSGGRSRGDPLYRCGRPVVQDGLCKRHLAGRARREANKAAWQAERDAQDQLLKHTNSVREEFFSRFGVTLEANYAWGGKGGWDGKLVIAEADLRKLVGDDQ